MGLAESEGKRAKIEGGVEEVAEDEGVQEGGQIVTGQLLETHTAFPTFVQKLTGKRLLWLTVSGVEKAFEDVTEEDQELMTPDEYTVRLSLLSVSLHASRG